MLGGLSLILSLLIAIPIGIAQAVKRNGLVDYAGTGVSFMLYSMPQYAIALLLIQFLSISFHVFPAEAPQGAFGIGMLSHPSGLVLPVASLTLVTYAQFSRYMRSSAIDTLAQDYMRTARAKGLPERLVLVAPPAAQLADLGRDAGGAVDPADPHRRPDHRAGLQLSRRRPGVLPRPRFNNDYEVMLGITVLVGLITVVGNLLADIGYAILDPRIRY